MIKQGEIFWYDFGPRSNHLQEGPRPVVVVQCDKLNQMPGYGNVIVAPLTTKERPAATYAAVSPSDQNQLKKMSWAITNQIFTLSKDDLKASLGFVSRNELFTIKRGLKISLGLD